MSPTIDSIEGRNVRLMLPNGDVCSIGDFSCRGTDLCCLHGSNGSGKSVFLGLLAGGPLPRGFQLAGELVARLSDGTTVAFSPQAAPVKYCQDVSVVLQRLGGTLIALRDNNDYGLAVEGASGELAQRDEWLREVLEHIGKETMLARQGTARSYAQTRLLEIACAASTAQSVFLLDEPFQGLDASSARIVRKLLHWLATKKKRLVIITGHERMTDGDQLGINITNVAFSDVDGRDRSDDFRNTLSLARDHLAKHETKPLVPDFDASIKPRSENVIYAKMRHLSAHGINWVIASNGGGKSTLAGAVGGLIRRGRSVPGFKFPAGFYIKLEGWEDRRLPNPDVHVVLQNPFCSFVENHVVDDLLEPFTTQTASFFGGTAKDPTKFSYGQLRYLQSLLIPAGARLVIFDEPLIGLAPANRKGMLDFIRSLPQTGRCVICTALNDDDALQEEPKIRLL